MVIAKTASRNVAFKVARMRESIMEDQDEFIMHRKSDGEEVGLESILLFIIFYWTILISRLDLHITYR